MKGITPKQCFGYKRGIYREMQESGETHFLFWIMVARAGTNSLMTIREVLIIRS